MRTLCAVLEVSPSGYYAWRDRPESARHVADRGLTAEIRRIHADTRAVYGSPACMLPCVPEAGGSAAIGSPG